MYMYAHNRVLVYMSSFTTGDSGYMCRIMSASSFFVNATIRKHVEGYRDRDHSFVEKFNRSIYVDDLTFGEKTEAKALELYQMPRQCWS